MFEMVWVWPVRANCFTCSLPRTECIPYPRSIFVCACGPNVLLSIVSTRGRAAEVLIACPHGSGEYFKELKNMAESAHEMPIFHHIPRWRSPIIILHPSCRAADSCIFWASHQAVIKLSSSCHPLKGHRIKLPSAGPSSWTHENGKEAALRTCKATWRASYILVRCV